MAQILKSSVVRLLVTVLTLASAWARDDPTPVAWPDAFQISFESNITLAEPALGGSTNPIKGYMWYDYSSRQQRVDHGGGNYECLKFYNSDLPCSLYFTPDGLYRVLSEPLPEGQPKCCLDMPDIHMTPPDWAQGTPATYDGLVRDWYSSDVAQHFSFNDAIGEDKSDPHIYMQIPSNAKGYAGYPLVFSFPVAEGLQDYHFKPESLRLHTPPASVFELPDGCAGVACPAPSR